MGNSVPKPSTEINRDTNSDEEDTTGDASFVIIGEDGEERKPSITADKGTVDDGGAIDQQTKRSEMNKSERFDKCCDDAEADKIHYQQNINSSLPRINITIVPPQRDYFLMACRNSHVLIAPRNIIVLGQTGAGKSSTIRNLLGQQLSKRPSSTDLIELNPGVYWQSKGKNRLRKVSKENEIESFKRSIIDGVRRAKDITHADLLVHLIQKPRSTSHPWPTDVSSFESYDSVFMQEVKMAVTKEVTNANLKNCPLSDQQQSMMVLYQIVDCGGMPFFRNLLPQFFPTAENTIFFIVHNLTDKLYENAQIRVLKNGKLVHQQELPERNIDEIIDWLKIAHSCSMPVLTNDGQAVANTFMVGTHFDHLQQKCFNIDLLAQEAAHKATNHICERIIPDPSHSVLDPEPVFLKNNLAGTDECPGIQKLRKKLWKHKYSSNHPIKLPVMWCLVIKRIKEIAEVSKMPVLPLDKFLCIAQSYHICETDAYDILEKCQELCIVFRLMNTSSYLNKFIFIDMQWLFTSLAGILHRPDTYSQQGNHIKDWKELTERGLMGINFHAHLFFHTPQVDCLPSTWASDLLEHLHLMSRVSLEMGDRFFCPILLPLLSNHNAADPFHTSDELDTLYVIPQNQSIPPGYLARLFTLMSTVSKNLKLVYCSCQTSATFQLLTDNPNESYFMRISENRKRGGMCLEFCNAFSSRINTSRLASIANRILLMVLNASDVLKRTWKLVPALDCPVILKDKSKDFPTLFIRCCNSHCVNSNHLARVHPQPLNKSKPYVQCTLNQNRMFFSDLPVSQLVWLIKLVEDKYEVCQLEQCLSKPIDREGFHKERVVRHTYPLLPFSPSEPFTLVRSGGDISNKRSSVQYIRPNFSVNSSLSSTGADDILLLHHQQTSQSTAIDQTSILGSYFMLLEDHLDLDICNYLFQYGVLNNNEKAKILEANGDVIATSSASAPNSRARAITLLLEALKPSEEHGFMAFVTALEATLKHSNSESTCGHRTILDHLQKDNNFMRIKSSWLSSLTVSSDEIMQS